MFSDFEDSDYDYVLTFEDEGSFHFVPLQMKQLPPNEVNSKVTLQEQVEKLKKYASSSDLIVAIHVNRDVEVELAELVLDGLNIGQLWIFGNCTPDGRKWRLTGDLLHGERCSTEFDLPEIGQRVST